ncbi:sensor histidine kinase [Aneurinibacillus tyrosinisolvens]|uniref:sensor histidine kinase n=1 Tax=Aneurinibacillus tyrosinisolvens TaxID=1443435 RepID=UPI00063F1B91|nr:ATP-binding protein [Aneurinibacillus tyrosinisolvens]
MTDEFSKHTGTRVHFQIQGEERGLTQHGKLTIVRCLQEALTNAKRHGEGTAITVILAFHYEELALEVHDNGHGAEAIHTGFGLKTMKERLEMLQGKLEITSSSGSGTKVVCSIPIKGEVVS